MMFKDFWKNVLQKEIMPYSGFDSAFKEDTEYYFVKHLFYKEVFEIPLDDIYESPHRPSQPDKVKRFSDAVKKGEQLPPIKLLFNPDPNGHDHFTILDGRGRLQTAIDMNFKKVAAVVTDIDPKNEREYAGFEEYKKLL